MTQYYYDKNGKPINEFDVLKVFHFVGARRKKHYMYKWVQRDDNDRMIIKHLTNADESVLLSAVVNKDGIFQDAEIVQTNYS